MPGVLVIPTGLCNLASVAAAIARCGAEAQVSDQPADIDMARLVVLPGVGSFGAAIAQLRRSGADDAIRRRVECDRPLLAICAGAQVLCSESEEGPGVEGLGIVQGSVRRLGGQVPVRLPQMMWNRVIPDAACRMVDGGDAYFANSYALMQTPIIGGEPCATAWSVYGGRFVAAFERSALVACQCHPELSGAWGRRLFARFIAQRSDLPIAVPAGEAPA